MTPTAFAILIGMFGAVLQELLFWYNLKAKLESAPYRELLTSPAYWGIVLAMIVGSGIASYVWFAPEQQTPRTYLLFGAAFPVLFKKALDAFIPKQARLGSGSQSNINQPATHQILRTYFRAS